MSDEIIGYAPIYKPRAGTIVTQAFILCERCGVAISPCSGPRHGALCLKCVATAPATSDAQTTARDVLREWGGHKDGCGALSLDPCTCGLQEAMEAASAASDAEDAARYRWLRIADARNTLRVVTNYGSGRKIDCDDLDAAIDAARGAK